MKKLWMPALLAGFLLTVPLWIQSAEPDAKADAELYLKAIRQMPIQENWGKMSGDISHIRRSQNITLDQRIDLGVRAAPTRVFAQLVLGGDEAYTVSQTFGEKPVTSILPLNWTSQKPQLPMYGIKPEDLTFSFLYWNFVKDLGNETLKLHACRIFELASPDGSEFVKVWIATSYHTPLKVEWYKKGETKYYRALEVSGVKKTDNGLWLVSELNLDGPGWRTSVKFTKIESGTVQSGVPSDLFKVKPLTDSAVKKE